MQVMNCVDILDLINIRILQGTPTIHGAPLYVQIEPIDRCKNIVFDTDALETLNNRVTEVVRDRQLSVRDPNSFKYVEEFVGRMVSELYRNGLVEIEEAKEGSDDPYEAVRHKYD